ncbi:MAG TPA: DoxX family protein [Puia sp.]|nr:DoxX family protein [Puia sp.]
MQTTLTTAPDRTPKATLWIGRVLTGICAAFLLFDAVMKIFPNKYVLDASATLGWTAGMLLPLGLVLLTITILYVIPRTAFLGTILLTGYLGGATCATIHNGPDCLFPIVFCILAWLGLMLTYRRNREFILSTFR